jgi:hypothetical protein
MKEILQGVTEPTTVQPSNSSRRDTNQGQDFIHIRENNISSEPIQDVKKIVAARLTLIPDAEEVPVADSRSRFDESSRGTDNEPVQSRDPVSYESSPSIEPNE